MPTFKDLEILSFETSEEFEDWLKENHATSPGLWIRMFKKATGKPSVSHDSALLPALCYGWIDAVSNRYDDESWLQKFTPRRKRSIWSKRNTEIVEKLIKEGKMAPAGLKEVEAAKADGRWDQAYDSPKNMVVPEDFLKELSKDKEAKAFFDSLNKTNLFAIAYRLQTAKKPETRERRMSAILEMMKKKQKFH